ncbi:LOW QUALITY PROTEIN: putative run and fyve domain containing protein [Schistosoma mansoni]|uniref:putative run and fyve domain containing protein n=1 Tax=Schistosoma mansoni TaxID=6183 RepID=UPI00022DCA74|nr:LOW QUALITY PROTEIN: putative run and fyve domain containing protein [Schistosoma mansoni]|eukprot:XP_018654522.1 LOW QUALITY PROTEIN: putative run and fyve domain containing protein [Schistosoma mansoni]
METERSNLLSIVKLVVRDLIRLTFDQQQVFLDENIWGESRTVHGEDVSNIVWRLLSVVEHCLCHGLRRESTTPDSFNDFNQRTSSKELMKSATTVIRRACDHAVSTANIFMKNSSHPNPWPVLLEAEKLSKTTDSISKTVDTMTEIRTGLGRSRVWLRQALMRKQLGEFFQVIIDSINSSNSNGSLEGSPKICETDTIIPETKNPSTFTTFYHSGALLLNNEGVVVTGLLATLNSIDFCFILKDNLSYMDKPLHVIPYHVYLQANLNRLEKLYSVVNLCRPTDLSSSIDQKDFLEDLCNVLKKRIDRQNAVNQRLNNEITNLSKQMESMKLENRSLYITVAQLKKDQVGLNTMHSESMETVSRINQLESELKHCQKTNEENSELVESIRSHLNESNKRCNQLTRYLSSLTFSLYDIMKKSLKGSHGFVHRSYYLVNTIWIIFVDFEIEQSNAVVIQDSQSSLEHKQTIIKQLEAKCKGMTNVIEQMNERNSLANEKVSQERDLYKLREELSNSDTRSVEQLKVIENQSSQIERLKTELNQQTIELDNSKMASDQLILCKLEVEELDKQLKVWRKRCEEQECSLSEMAAVVNSSKLEAESLRESHSAFSDAQWANDSEIQTVFFVRVRSMLVVVGTTAEIAA